MRNVIKGNSDSDVREWDIEECALGVVVSCNGQTVVFVRDTGTIELLTGNMMFLGYRVQSNFKNRM